MLVLVRREGESLIIRGDIKVKALRCCSGRVILGIEAPMDVKVLREELWNKLSPEEKQRIVLVEGILGFDEEIVHECLKHQTKDD